MSDWIKREDMERFLRARLEEMRDERDQWRKRWELLDLAYRELHMRYEGVRDLYNEQVAAAKDALISAGDQPTSTSE